MIRLAYLFMIPLGILKLDLQNYYDTLMYCLKRTCKRERDIYLPVPKFIPISPNIRLIATSEEVLSYEDIYRRWCAINGKEYEDPLEYYQSQLKK